MKFGTWVKATGQFTEFPGSDLSLANAVRVRGELSNVRNDAVKLFFAPIPGHSTHQVADEAIAVIGRTGMLVMEWKRPVASITTSAMATSTGSSRSTEQLVAAVIRLDWFCQEKRSGIHRAAYS